MVPLPEDYGAMISALMLCLGTAQAGMLLADRDDDPEMMAAALDDASARMGVAIRRTWLDNDRESLAWLREDDERLRADPDLAIIGVMH